MVSVQIYTLSPHKKTGSPSLRVGALNRFHHSECVRRREGGCNQLKAAMAVIQVSCSMRYPLELERHFSH